MSRTKMALSAAEAGFDYRRATEEEVLRRGRLLAGRRLGELTSMAFKEGEAKRRKGEVGLLVELFFGIPPNSLAAADFPAAGIELKAVPLVRTGKGLRSKERTVISMIDYGALPLETWTTAHVRRKLRILFVFYEYILGASTRDFPIRSVVLWEPHGLVLDLVKQDWYAVKVKVTEGRAHELSESDGRLMGPCTKGVDSTRRVRQPVTVFTELAKPRAFALKPALTLSIFREAVGELGATESLLSNLRIDRPDRLEAALLESLSKWVGQKIHDIGDQLGVPRSVRKDYAAAVIRKAMGAKSHQTKIEEFERSGLTLRVVRVSQSRSPYEATSFPAFRYAELVEEEWEDSSLLAQVSYMLFVPFIGGERSTPPGECMLGRPVFWRPSPDDLRLIESEWLMYREEIRRGLADNLPPASETKAIHVRPHGRDRKDVDPAPGLGPVIKKSFWLNKSFVEGILRGEEHLGNG